MHSESKGLLKVGITECLPDLQRLVQKHTCHQQRALNVTGNEVFVTRLPKVDIGRLLDDADGLIRTRSRPFSESFYSNHPDCGGMVSFPGLGSAYSIVQDALAPVADPKASTCILRAAFRYLWDRHESFELDESVIDSVVDEFAAFVDEPTVLFIFRTMLLNFEASVDRISLPEGITIRRMTDKELWRIQSLTSMSATAASFSKFCIEGRIEEPKVFVKQGQLDRDLEHNSKARVKASLDKAILCLRTFKAGQIGYDNVWFRPLSFCPAICSTTLHSPEYVSFDIYKLTEAEVESLPRHSSAIFSLSEPSMKMACLRLSDAELRPNPRDRIVDAVIGMESLLLARLPKEDRRGELKLRFSLHYSTLFGPPTERYRAFRLAKDLYDLRSTIAHGSALAHKRVRVGDEKLPLAAAARKATDVLRNLIKCFLPDVDETPYKDHEFWERAMFGLPDRGSGPRGARLCEERQFLEVPQLDG